MTDGDGDRIRAARTARGMGQAELATAVGVSNSYLSHIEAGRRPASADLLSQIATALGLTVQQLQERSSPGLRDEVQLRLRFAELSLRNGDCEVAFDEFSAGRSSAESLQLGDLAQEAIWGLARAHEVLGRVEQAITHYEELLGSDRLVATVDRAAVAVALTRAYSECGDLDRAIDVGEQAVAASGSTSATASDVELASTLAGCYLERGDVTRAHILITTALQTAERDGSLRARGAASWNAAVVALAQHDFATARVNADRALALYSELENARAVGLLRVVSACVHLRNEPPDPAAAAAELGVAISELSEVGTQVDLGYAHTELARARLLAGETEDALRISHAALGNLEGGDRLQRGHTLLVVGHAQVGTGEAEAGFRSYKEAAECLQAAGASKQAARAWRELGEAFIQMGHPDEAIDALRKASDVLGAKYWPLPSDATAGHAVSRQ